MQVRVVQCVYRPQLTEVEGGSRLIDIVGGELELAEQQLTDLRGHVGRDLEANCTPKAAPAQLELDGGEQVVGLILLQREVGVPGHAEDVPSAEAHLREQVVKVGGDHLLERHEAVAMAHSDETRQQRRHLHPCEALLVSGVVGHDDTQVEGEVRDVGERVARVDCQRGEHRKNVPLEGLQQLGSLVVVEALPGTDLHTSFGERRQDLLVVDDVDACQLGAALRSDGSQLLDSRHPVG